MSLGPGALIGNNVRLIRPLTRGGMGSVWIGEHLTLKTEVAVKLIADSLVGDAGFLARFSREASASAVIKSPHVVQVFDHGVTSDGIPYIVMELLEGEDLRTRLLREKKLPLAETQQIIAQVARALGRAHAANVVHRDIKPGNLFLMDHDGELFVKVLDFGIAKQMGDLQDAVTATGQIIGTPHYVSPEQIKSPKNADAQCDLWSLAVVAYRCLTGELPFDGETVGAVSIAIDKALFLPVTTRQSELPPMLDAWFDRALARSKASRFTSAKELAIAFEAAARNEPMPSRAPSEEAAMSLSGIARLAAPATDVTPGAVPLRTTANDDPTKIQGDPKPQAFNQRTDVAQRATTTPLGLAEPTLSQGTVTSVGASGPRRTRIYGAALLLAAAGGALAVALFSRGSAPPEPGLDAAGSTPIATTTATVTDRGEPVEPAVTARPTAAPTTDPAPTAQPIAESTGTATRRTAPTPTTSASAKKKKDRGF